MVEEMEVCSGRARIDLAVIGDRLIGIEIKGPRDSVTRLPDQAKAYSQCFDHVVLIVHESLAAKARPLIPNWWGLIAGRQVDGRIRYRVVRRLRTNPSLNLERVLSLLWREETLQPGQTIELKPGMGFSKKVRFSRPTCVRRNV